MKKISPDYQAFLDKITESLTYEELVDVIEAGRLGLQDGHILGEMDLAEDYAYRIVEQLDQKVMGEVT